MNKLKMVALVLGALTCLAAFAAAQANLPPEARLQVLIAQTESAIANGDEARALGFLGQMNGISGAVRPASTYLLEARLAGRSQDYDRAMQALEGYFKVAQPNDPEYAAAAQLYAAAESLKEEAARKAEAERTSGLAERVESGKLRRPYSVSHRWDGWQLCRNCDRDRCSAGL
jgi:hypothetical protein